MQCMSLLHQILSPQYAAQVAERHAAVSATAVGAPATDHDEEIEEKGTAAGRGSEGLQEHADQVHRYQAQAVSSVSKHAVYECAAS